MSDKNQNKIEEASLDFLENDFNQCFAQARYYDAQTVDIFKFLATFYTTIAGIAIGLYQYSLDKNIELTLALVSGLLIALIFGICMFFLMVRNRVYFVFCMRYINEQRGLFLSLKPAGFENKSRFYTNYKQPPFFNWLSSQSWWLYVVAVLNSALLIVVLYLMKISIGWIITSAFLFIFSQLISGICYLKYREDKSASHAVFGNKK